MQDTVQALSDGQKRRFVSANAGDAAASPWHLDALAGAGALCSTAADMLALGEALLDPEHPLAPAWKLASTLRADIPAQGSRIGLAVFDGKQRGEAFLWHNGGTGGFRSEFRVYPATRRAPLETGAVYARLDPPPAPLGARQETPIALARLAELAGVYKVDQQAAFTVILRDGQPWVRLTAQPFLPILHEKGERFFYKAVPAELQFKRDADGKASALVLFQNDREMHAALRSLFATAQAISRFRRLS